MSARAVGLSLAMRTPDAGARTPDGRGSNGYPHDKTPDSRAANLSATAASFHLRYPTAPHTPLTNRSLPRRRGMSDSDSDSEIEDFGGGRGSGYDS